MFDRDGIYALEDLLESFDLPLTSAVRASANFPFGFPLISILTTPEHLRYSPKTTDAKEVEVNLTDGGVLSNSGMWSLYNLLMKDGDVVERLKRRGALLILVEASKMPSVNETIHKTLALGDQITDKGPKGQRLHRMMFENLQRAYGPLLKILQVDLEPTENFNVGTTLFSARSTGLRSGASSRSSWTEFPKANRSWLPGRAARDAQRRSATETTCRSCPTWCFAGAVMRAAPRSRRATP